MTEVEKEIKFSPDPGTLRRLVTGTPRHIDNHDVYYGFPDIDGVHYPLVRQNAWLRRRNDEYELKIVQESNRQGGLKVSREVPNDKVESTLDDLLAEHDVDHAGLADENLQPLVYMHTARRRYTQDAVTHGIDTFTVDVDTVRYWAENEGDREQNCSPDMTWYVGEIDITAQGRRAAKEEIERVVQRYGLDVHERRKVVTYFDEIGGEICDYIPGI